MSLRSGWERELDGETTRMKAVNFSEGLEPDEKQRRGRCCGVQRACRAQLGGQGPTVLQVVEGKVPEVGGELGQRQEPPGQHVPEEPGAGAVWEQPVLDDLPERCSQHPGCDPGAGDRAQGGSPPAWCARSCRQRRSRHPTGTGFAAGKPAPAPGGCSGRWRGSAVAGSEKVSHLVTLS